MMNQREEVAETRRRVENQYGRELASKASDVFCLAFGRQTPQVFAAFEEAVTEAPPASAIVVECAPQQESLDRVRSAAEAVKRTPAWGRLQESLAEVRTPELKLQTGRMLRQAAIQSVRDDFYKTAGPNSPPRILTLSLTQGRGFPGRLQSLRCLFGCRPEAEKL